jgi:Uncharacterized protein conserved in bacteria
MGFYINRAIPPYIVDNKGVLRKKMKKRIFTCLIVFLLCFTYVQYVSIEPKIENIETITKEYGMKKPESSVGSATTATLSHVINVLLTKNNGYTSNDLLVKVGLFDNMPSWEKGVLFQSRDLYRSLRDEMSRSQTQSIEDAGLSKGQPKINYDNDVWNPLVSTEGRYKESKEYLDSYLKRLIDTTDSRTQFYARADNLAFWLDQVSSRLGSLSQKLSASVASDRINTDLAGDSKAKQSTYASNELKIKTSWFEIDDVFWESRGSCWALIQFLKAVEVDFDAVLKDRNATISLRQIIKELEGTQESLWSPVILNGDGFGFVANHSLTMANYISRANAAVIELRSILRQR